MDRSSLAPTLSTRLGREFYALLVFEALLFGAMPLLFLFTPGGAWKNEPELIAVGALFLFGWLAVTAWNYRRSPRFLDPTGVTRRDGQRFEWKDLTKVNRITRVHTEGKPPVFDRLDLRFRDGGDVRISPFIVADIQEIIRFVDRIDRRRRCATCQELSDFDQDLQDAAEGARLPAATFGSLRTIRKNAIPGNWPSVHLLQCPNCERHYRYEQHEAMVHGSANKERLSLISDDEAAKLQHLE
jgi:hypothetical protein